MRTIIVLAILLTIGSLIGADAQDNITKEQNTTQTNNKTADDKSIAQTSFTPKPATSQSETTGKPSTAGGESPSTAGGESPSTAGGESPSTARGETPTALVGSSTTGEPLTTHTATESSSAPQTPAAESTTEDSTKSTEHSISTAGTENTHVIASTTAATPSNIFVLKDDSGNICILLQLDATFTISYKTNEDKDLKYTLDVPKTANVNDKKSSCSTDPQFICLEFNTTSFTMYFNKSSDNVAVNELKLDYVLPADAEGTVKTMSADNKEVELFSVAANKSYKCNSEITQDLNENVTLTIKNFKGQAFMNAAEPKFDNEIVCPDDDVNDVIPIAVGCALAGLVIIVLVAYLVGRRRSHQRGYQSV